MMSSSALDRLLASSRLDEARAELLRAEEEEHAARRQELQALKDKLQTGALQKASLAWVSPDSYRGLPLLPGVPAFGAIAPRQSKRAPKQGHRRALGAGVGDGLTVRMPDTLVYPGMPAKPFWLIPVASGGPPARRRLPRQWRASFFARCCSDLFAGQLPDATKDIAVRFFDDKAGKAGPGAEDAKIWDVVVAVKKVASWGKPQTSRTSALTARGLRMELKRDIGELDGCCLQVGDRIASESSLAVPSSLCRDAQAPSCFATAET